MFNTDEILFIPFGIYFNGLTVDVGTGGVGWFSSLKE